MNIAVLRKLDIRADEAVEDVRAEMMRLWPEGAVVKAKLQTNHKTPASCTVLFHPAGARGYMRVRVAGGHETTIHFDQVVS